ncbi:MAG TPA: nucleotidyltransferase domain-containing protein [Candidatus Nanoarchaeia archaeon]|nr:nucleotidyltransferase domain-containing protein [Candidatus Nanoarchaeia archaeon]
MAKKKETKDEKETKYEKKEEKAPEVQLPQNLPPEVVEKLKVIKEKLEKFQKLITEKFDKYIVGVALLPPPRPPAPDLPPDILFEEKKRYEQEKDKYHALVLIDDSEPTKMTKGELRDKLGAIMDVTAKEIDPNILPQTLLLSELWQNCYDGKYDLLQLIGMSAPIYDTGMLGAIRIAELHKTMVLKKFEKYIVTYVLAGSLVQGRATKESDIDVFVVIDDTDVKKMTRSELRDKLRAIIIGMGAEAGEITGIRNKINIQIYILTDFWESIRESNPVIFTFLRDGVPFYDRGIFMPWKQLLKMGKIKPSAEAIDLFMSTGEQTLDRVKFKLRDIGVEDFFWGIHTPTQAALMLYGIPPPAPKETCAVLREVFVQKEKLLEEEYVKILEEIIQMRKDIEHGVKKDVTGKEIDKLLADSDKYMKRLKRLFTQIEKLKDEENMIGIYDTIQTILRDVLKMEGVETATEGELGHLFEEQLISKGKVPAKYLRTLHDLIKAKANYDAGKITKTEVEKVRKESNELIRFLIEYMQRKRAHELERAKLRIKHGQKYGEITLLGNTAYIVADMDAPERKMEKADIKPDGSLTNIGPCKPEEYEASLAKIAVTKRISLREPLFESLKKIFGDYELLL